MRSRAHIKGHPIHPAVIPFPFAFLWGAALFDLLYLGSGRDAFTTTAAHLTIAGIAAGLLAAVPGVIDYVYSVPPASSARRRATRHALGNVAALALFGVSWLLRDAAGAMTPPTLVLEILGAALLAYSGLLGGVLVVRNMISVDHRHARAGRWKEEDFAVPAGGEIAVARADELEEGQMKLVRVNGTRIALARTAQGYCAVADRCSHRGGSLADGVLIGTTVQCLWHGSRFDVRTGKVACGPAEEPVATWSVREKDGAVLLAVRRPSGS
ncbi:MAG TPA: DUF2231 domain-containing protein [Vicinamibacterales bacterium]|nr:DUF2231 domain-containing protein [Vicinamibacterales bacterium]